MRDSVASPQWPSASGARLSCTWAVSVAEGNLIRFSVTGLDELGDPATPCRRFASLSVLDGPADAGPRLLQRLCHARIGLEPVLSSGHTITLQYSQGWRQSKGFMAHYATGSNFLSRIFLTISAPQIIQFVAV